MKERLPAWGARTILLLIGLAVIYGLAQFPIHHSQHFWPYGHLHYIWQGIFVVCSYIIVGIAVVAVCLYLFFESLVHLKFLLYIASYRRVPTWRRRWSWFDDPKGYTGPWITRPKPRSLLRGRVGSR